MNADPTSRLSLRQERRGDPNGEVLPLKRLAGQEQRGAGVLREHRSASSSPPSFSVRLYSSQLDSITEWQGTPFSSQARPQRCRQHLAGHWRDPSVTAFEEFIASLTVFKRRAGLRSSSRFVELPHVRWPLLHQRQLRAVRDHARLTVLDSYRIPAPLRSTCSKLASQRRAAISRAHCINFDLAHTAQAQSCGSACP